MKLKELKSASIQERQLPINATAEYWCGRFASIVNTYRSLNDRAKPKNKRGKFTKSQAFDEIANAVLIMHRTVFEIESRRNAALKKS